MPDLPAQVWAAVIVLAGTLATVWVSWRRDRRKEPVEESTAAYAGAKVLSDGVAVLASAVREDLVRMRADLDMLRVANSSLRADVEALQESNSSLKVEVSSLRAENEALSARNRSLTEDLNDVYQWIADGAQPPPPQRRT